MEKNEVKGGLAQYGYYVGRSKKRRKIEHKMPLNIEELECLEKKWGDKKEIIKEENPRTVFFNLGNQANLRSSPGEN